MSKKKTYILAIVFINVIGLLLYIKFCNCTYTPKVEIKEEPKVRIIEEPVGLFSIGGNGFSENCNANFVFNQHQSEINKPINECIIKSIERLKNYIYYTPKENIYIDGFAMTQELNNNGVKNLGLARAEAIKALLVAEGIDASKVYTNGSINSDIFFINQSLMNPIRIYVGSVPKEIKPVVPINENKTDSSSNLKTTQNASSKSLTLYYNYNSTQIIITKEQDTKLGNIAYEMSLNSNSILNIVGFADEGNDAQRIGLANKRANYVKDFFIGNGIPSNRIVVEAKPYDASNPNNKKVVITLK